MTPDVVRRLEWLDGEGRGASMRVEYYHDPAAPRPNSIAPSVFAVVRNDAGQVLLVRRADSGNWEVPGGRVDVGESATDAVTREVAEESAVTIKVLRLAGVYTDPGHVMAYSSGEVRQQFALCFHAIAVDVDAHPEAYSDAHPDAHADQEEMTHAAWIDVEELDRLPIHESVRLRLDHALQYPDQVHVV